MWIIKLYDDGFFRVWKATTPPSSQHYMYIYIFIQEQPQRIATTTRNHYYDSITIYVIVFKMARCFWWIVIMKLFIAVGPVAACL